VKWKDEWPPLIFLSEVYTQALKTMGDDEFFSSSSPSYPSSSHPSSSSSTQSHNPLTLDDLSSLTRKLLNIAFTLYSKEGSEEERPLQMGVEMGRWTWEGVRECVGKCLIGVHAREYVGPFFIFFILLSCCVLIDFFGFFFFVVKFEETVLETWALVR
jgi:ubiquitin-protein ligase E3 C